MISVVVPIYNQEKYIRRCVDSILGQTYRDLEIILVDDGSGDATPAICDGYAEADGRVVVIHKENGGLMKAWQTGVLSAKGDYIGFVDSDDWIDEDMYQRLHGEMERHDADMVLCGMFYEAESGTYRNPWAGNQLSSGIYEGEAVQKEILDVYFSNPFVGDRRILVNRFTKLYKKQLLINNIKYLPKEVSIGEDLLTTLSCMLDCKKVCCVNEYFPYHYWFSTQSMTGAYDEKYYVNLKKCYEAIHAMLKQKGIVMKGVEQDFLHQLLIKIKKGMQRNRTMGAGEMCRQVRQVLEKEEIKECAEKSRRSKMKLGERIFLFMAQKRLCYLLVLLVRLLDCLNMTYK